MAYNTKMIKTDVDKKPIPQIYNPVNDEYEVLQGANGAARHIIYGTDGQPVSTPGNKLAIRASEIETQLTAIQGYIDGLEGAIGEAQAAPTANTLLARLKNLETKVDAIIADGIKLSGSNVRQTIKRFSITQHQWGYVAVGTSASDSSSGVASLDITKYKDVLIEVKNGTGQVAYLNIYCYPASISGITYENPAGSGAVLVENENVAAGATFRAALSTLTTAEPVSKYYPHLAIVIHNAPRDSTPYDVYLTGLGV